MVSTGKVNLSPNGRVFTLACKRGWRASEVVNQTCPTACAVRGILRPKDSGKKKLTRKAQRSKEQVREGLLSNSGLTMPETPGGNKQE
jgi:hypothetical protein